jgi:4-hydroxy-4-methyl-2-oxoglutarate aldolase
MDANECRTLIPAARGSSGITTDELLARIDAAGEAFGKAAQKKFGKKGEW